MISPMYIARKHPNIPPKMTPTIPIISPLIINIEAIILAFAPSVLNTAISLLLLLTMSTRQATMLNPAIAMIIESNRTTNLFSIFIALNKTVISDAHVFILKEGCRSVFI